MNKYEIAGAISIWAGTMELVQGMSKEDRKQLYEHQGTCRREHVGHLRIGEDGDIYCTRCERNEPARVETRRRIAVTAKLREVIEDLNQEDE